MDELSDGNLVNFAKQGNILAFEQLVKRYEQKLISFAFRYIRDIHAAEEAVSDAFFLFYKHINAVDVSKKISTYLFEITKNRAISELRKKKQTTKFHEGIMEDREDYYENIEKRDNMDMIHAVLHSLDVRYRSVLEMYYLNDVSYGEMAKDRKSVV